jgi:predicted HAD superfamily Cof-like phosphohydrolase
MRLPIRDEPTRHIPQEERQLRLRLIEEEVGELADAMTHEDLVEIADALADLVYVTYGTALHYGLDLDAAVAEVHRSNMSKAASRGSVMRGDGKVLKNPKYRAPDLRRALGLDDEDH